jgi:hypothetical protein
VLAGSFGPPGHETWDIYGAALNQLFKLGNGDFVITDDVRAALGPA